MIKNKNKTDVLCCKFFIIPIFILLIFLCISACSKKPSSQKVSESNKLICPVPRTIYSQDEQDIARKNLDKKGIPFSSESLLDAIESNDRASVLDMIKLGINLEDNGKGTSRTPLTAALFGNKREIINLLVKNGASVNTKDGGRAVPFISAIRSGDENLAKEFINLCAHVNIYDGGGNALSVAIDKQNLEIVRLLIEKGVDINKESGYGMWPLITASTRDSLEIVKLLVENGGNIKMVTTEGWTPLIAAMLSKQYEIAKYLIEHGANLDSRTNLDGYSAISEARKQGRQDILDLLASKGINN